MASRVAGPRTLGPPLYIAIQNHNSNSNSNCNSISSARCAHSGLPTVSSCLYGEQPGDAALATLVSAPCSPFRTTTQTQTTTATQTPPLAALAPATLPTVSKQPQLKLKLKLKLKLQLHLLRSLRSRFAYGLLMPVWRADGGRCTRYARQRPLLAIQNQAPTETQTTTATQTPPLAALAPATLPTVSMLRRSK